LEESGVRVLVVDDYEPWRRFVLATLGNKPQLRVVDQAADGLQAVQIAQLQQPDLVLLDIGLPTLNGIEVARRILELSPKSKILFLSENRSLEVVEAALATGVMGYVVKSDAASDLLPAIEAVLQNKQFVSSAVTRAGFSNGPTAQPGRRDKRDEANHSKVAPRHEVVFYSDDKEFLDASIGFLGTALAEGNAVLIIVSESRRIRLLAELRAIGLDMETAIREGRYISLDPAETLSAFMIDDLPDAERFFQSIGNLVTAAAHAAKGEQPRVIACAECAPDLWIQGKANAAIQLERLCNRLIKTYPLDVLCGYALSSFEGGSATEVFNQLCAEHSAVYPSIG
jgi:DNA-binding NarL/FixJ family response regulator